MEILPDLQKPFASEIFVKLSETVRANDSHNLQGLCKTPTGWLRMAHGGWKNADTKIKKQKKNINKKYKNAHEKKLKTRN